MAKIPSKKAEVPAHVEDEEEEEEEGGDEVDPDDDEEAKRAAAEIQAALAATAPPPSRPTPQATHVPTGAAPKKASPEIDFFASVSNIALLLRVWGREEGIRFRQKILTFW
jgi:hypothetical protein